MLQRSTALVLLLAAFGIGTAHAQLYSLSQTLQGPTPMMGNAAGSAVAVVGDNILIGAPFDSTGASNAGAAYLYDGKTGALLHTFLSPTPASGDNFGYAVAAVGNNVLIGAPFDSTAGSSVGAAYLFSGSTGALLHVFVKPTPAFFDQFGNSVAALGNNVLIGAPGDDTGAVNAGAAYLFDGSSGALIRTFTKPTPVSGDQLGYVVAALNGNVLAGVPFDDTGATDAGAVYLFDANTGAILQSYFNPSPANGDEFGFSLAAQGSDILVGAPFDNQGATDAGTVYLMDGTSGALIRTFSDPLLLGGDNFGYSVAAVGNNLLAGAPFADTGATDAGVAYLISGTTGALLQTIENPTPVTGDQFGNSVAYISGGLIVGAPGDDTTATDAGAAYLFDPCGTAPEPPGHCTQPDVPGKALFKMKNNVLNNRRDLVLWKWLKGPTTPKSDFGDPTSATSYALCAYNDPGGLGSPQLIYRATAAAGGLCRRGKPCWKSTRSGYKYVNKDTTPDGVLNIVLVQGTVPDKAKIIFRAKHELVQFPTMPLTAPTDVTVQLKNSDGKCWEAVYSNPPLQNRSDLFKARAD